MRPAIKGILFDLDDTLLDHIGASRTAVLAYAATLPDWTRDEAATLDHWFAMENEHFARYLTGEYTMQEQRRARLRGFLDLPDTDDDALDEQFERYLEHYEGSWQAFPGAPELVLRLLDDGFQVGILTNGASRQQRAKITAIGLDDPRLVVCVSEELPAPKPSPLAFAAACTALDLPPDQVLMVGDNPVTDIEGALAAGLHAAHVSREGVADRPGWDSRVQRISVVTELQLSPHPT
ncbi:MAG: HAD family hydrolase [Microlunatus sp.]